MKRLIASLCFVLIFGTSGIAQESTVSNTAPSKDAVLRFLDLMQVRARMEQMLDGMKQAMKVGAEAGFKQRVPGATPAQLEKVNGFADVIFKDMPIDEMVDAMIPIYQKHIDKSDLDAIIAFYSSPVGQRLLKEQPAMMEEAMKAGQEIMLRRLPDLEERLKTKVAQLADEEIQKSAPIKKPVSN